MIVLEVQFNWHQHPEHGCNFDYYRVGERYARIMGGSVKCEKIELDFGEGMHAIIQFEDGTVEKQWNINKIIESEHGDNKTQEYQGDNPLAELSESGSTEEIV